VEFTVSLGDRNVRYECIDRDASHVVDERTLEGKTCPYLPFVDDVRAVWDVGAGCGAASVYFAHRYPAADVHAFEADPEARAYLERNTAAFPNVRVHGAVSAEAGVERIDVLKVAVDRGEIDILRAVAGVLPEVAVAYVRYTSRATRRDLRELLEPSHELYRGRLLLDEGDCVYLRRDLADHPEANPTLQRLFVGGVA
jgi:hypothetical protein